MRSSIDEKLKDQKGAGNYFLFVEYVIFDRYFVNDCLFPTFFLLGILCLLKLGQPGTVGFLLQK